MAKSRKIEIFSAGCVVCDSAVAQIRAEACSSCDIVVLDIRNADVATRAVGLGIRSVPAVVIDGKLADCCVKRGPDLDVLRAAGLGRPMS